MREFRWTAIVGVLLAAVWGLSHFYGSSEHPEADGAYVAADSEALFRFEKEEVVRIEIRRPEDTLVLSDTRDGWIVEPGGFPASRSMVSRIKHQLHDLDARARVVEEAESFALYGLGDQAIEVSVSMRDGQVVRFAAGDPNPTSVSFYIRPLPGDVIYTVKKSAVDFYSFEPTSFREPRFASMSSRDAVRLEAELPDGYRLVMQKVGEDRWELMEPVSLEMETDRARSLLGRLGALKAKEFVQEVEDSNQEELALYGLKNPRARVVVSFGSRDPLELWLGRDFSDQDDSLAYMKLAGESTVYVAKELFLRDFAEDPMSFRNRSFVTMPAESIRQVEIELASREESEFSGSLTLRQDSDAWKWEDGRPVPGSTPKRLVERLSTVRANDFVDNPTEWAVADFENPVARVTVRDGDGGALELLVGQKGPPLVPDEIEEEERPPMERYYAKLRGGEAVYLIDPGILDVLEDAVRESQRKEAKDAEQDERRELMDMEMGQ